MVVRIMLWIMSISLKLMLALYKELQKVKQMVIDKLDHLEEFRTFVQTDKGYKVQLLKVMFFIKMEA
ncbi:MAG: hypothetical protein CM15mV3_1590 [Caudoviricetes sp.]|nr:MAG: hypothetical protein CM15mV3_1590 [Caudoviricetes sp.]